ncbi:MAG TPA: outer membrane protein assembly factor BamC [Rhodocyclaceae bacterium]|nr:outer membrane protein assembly factor BamC [Rhodocyclaceae bacterium]
MNRKLLLVALAAPALLAACGGSVLESKKIDYKAVSKLPPLDVPPDLTQPSRDDRYAVPDTGPNKSSATYSAYAGERGGKSTATTQELLPEVPKMRVERDGNQRWLVVPGTPDKVWPVVKDFWRDMGLPMSVELPEAGIMETDWAENRAKIPQGVIRDTLSKVFDDVYSTPERDKYRTRLEPGTQPGTTEIYISHRGMYEIYINEGKMDTRWQPRPPDPDLEAEMLRRLMVRMGADELRAKTLVAEAAAAKEDKAKLLPEQEGGGLSVLEPFDRGWRRVGLALDRVGFTVEDRDRAQGVYFVRYVDPEKDGKKDDDGFFSRLFSSKSDTEKKQRYRIQVKAAGETTSVKVLAADGSADSSETGKKILRLLHEQLK